MAGAGTASSKSSVAVPPSKAQEFLAKLSRTKRNIWDRSRPDVQQWIMQFMYMGYDEQVSCESCKFPFKLVTLCNNNKNRSQSSSELLTMIHFKKQVVLPTFEKKKWWWAKQKHIHTQKIQKHKNDKHRLSIISSYQELTFLSPSFNIRLTLNFSNDFLQKSVSISLCDRVHLYVSLKDQSKDVVF